jgi:MFS family permease
LPGGIWALGFVSLFMDISSEMIHGLLPVFLTSVLCASTEMIGLIEGVGEATASISKLFSDRVSDKLGKRKARAVIGYGLGALSKPLFALAPTSSLVLAARFSDRVGKGIRGAPRDAMVGDMVPADLRGAAYGLRQALDTVGGFAGPLIDIALMATPHDNFRLIFWLYGRRSIHGDRTCWSCSGPAEISLVLRFGRHGHLAWSVPPADCGGGSIPISRTVGARKANFVTTRPTPRLTYPSETSSLVICDFAI